MTERARDVEPQPPRRGRPRRASAGEAILEATLALLAERGFQATTIEAIADRAGVGRNTICNWASKEELIADALHELTADLDVFEAAGDLLPRLLERIRDLVRVFSDPLFGRILPSFWASCSATRPSRGSTPSGSCIRVAAHSSIS